MSFQDLAMITWVWFRPSRMVTMSRSQNGLR